GMVPARRGAAQSIVSVERALRCLERDLRQRCAELLGSEELAVLPDDSQQEGQDESQEASGSPREDKEQDLEATVEAEARAKLPIAESSQLQSLVGLRHAQQRSSLALAEFVELPQKLKMVFDLTKRLGSEVEAQLARSAHAQVLFAADASK
ncbi:unnamed protein product, partial [Polarella glacialis]